MSDYELREFVSAAVTSTARLIAGVHSRPDFSEIAVFYYTALQPFGRYVPGDGIPGHIELSLFGPHPRLTFAHERGHLLDQAIMRYTGYASATPFSLLHDVMGAIQQSAAYNQMQTLISSSGMSVSDEVARRRARYWLNSEELWARAYAQYIAVRSGNTDLQSDVNLAQVLETHEAGAFVQWEQDDYTPIAQAIDSAFAQMGWLP